MASASFGDWNHGFQAHTINGPVNTTFHLSPERSETPPKPSCVIPFRRDTDFVDRGTLLDQIHEKCSAPASRAALVGLGGVGKSQLAIEHCYRAEEASLDRWVFWVHAGTRARFEEGYRRIAEATKMSGWDNPKTDILRLVRSWLCDKRKGHWLMVVDNADDASVFFQDVPQSRMVGGPVVSRAELLSDFLPQSPNGSILFTSRSRDAAYKLTGDYTSIIEVRPMDKDDALALLHKKLGSIAREDEAIELICALDFMPLALTQAAAFVRQRAPQMSLSRYTDEVHRSERDRAWLLEKDVGDSRRDSRASNSIIATWQISFEHIREQMPMAAQLLSLMSLFDRQGIPEWLLRKRYGGDKDKDKNEDNNANFSDDIHTLISFSLVDVGADEREFAMHRLVQFSTKKWLELSNELERWKRTYAVLMDESYPIGRYENWLACQALFPHAAAVLNSRPENAEALRAWASVLFKAAWYAGEMGQYKVAEKMHRAALKEREFLLGLEHGDTLTSVNSLATVLQDQGKYEEAEKLIRRALKGREKGFGPQHPDTLMSMNSLALVLQCQRKHEDAEKLIRRVLERSEKELGPQHPNVLTSVGNLALVLQDRRKYEEAEKLNRQVLKRREKELGPQHPHTLMSVNNLATVLHVQGKYREAEKLNRQALEGREKELGPQHPHTLMSVGNLATTFQDQGKYDEAETLIRRVLNGREKKLGPQHPDTLMSVGNLAAVLHAQGKNEEAEKLNRQALEGSEKELGPQHPDTLTSMSNLALVLQDQRKYEEAEKLIRRALKGREKGFGPQHPDTLTSMSNLALVLQDQRKYDEAETLIRRVLNGREKELGPQHPDTLMSVNNLASALRDQGKYDEAEMLIRRAVKGWEKELGPQHPNALMSVGNLAAVLHAQGKNEEAEKLNRQALEGSEKELGPQHPDTLTSMSNLALVLQDQRKYDEAEKLIRRAVEGWEKELGMQHLYTLTSIYRLAHLLQTLRRYAEAVELYQQAFGGYAQQLGSQHPTTIACHEHFVVMQQELEQGRSSQDMGSSLAIINIKSALSTAWRGCCGFRANSRKQGPASSRG